MTWSKNKFIMYIFFFIISLGYGEIAAPEKASFITYARYSFMGAGGLALSVFFLKEITSFTVYSILSTIALIVNYFIAGRYAFAFLLGILTIWFFLIVGAYLMFASEESRTVYYSPTYNFFKWDWDLAYKDFRKSFWDTINKIDM